MEDKGSDKSKDKKVVSIVNGKPVDATPEIDQSIIAVLETLLKQAYAGNIDQLAIITMSDDAVMGARIIAGDTINPEIVFTQIELLKDDYKDIYIRQNEYYYDGSEDE